jgi:hypothetical protein
MTMAARAGVLLILIVLLVSGGCAAASVATVGSIAGIAASSISTGAEIYNLGKLDAVEMDRFEDCDTAVRLAVSDLQLSIIKDAFDPRKSGRRSFRLSDDLKETIDIRVQRRTERLTAIRIDVGLFGSEPTARLVLARIRAHLPSHTLRRRDPAATTRSR